MPLIKIDDRELEVQAGDKLLAVALAAGLEIPHYCYHPALSVTGSCRMCLVEIEGMPRLQTSCSVPVSELPPEKKVDGKFDMVVHTQSEKVVAARKLVLEFLLLNHPLDCPVCDQAGECFLQDYSFQHGNAHSRFIEDKRVRANEDLGSGVVINHNRCIMCTRCVRFTREIAGTGELYVQNRGYNNKIAVFDSVPLDNPLAGNVADICPVGALLLKDYIHTTRFWHLSQTPSVCTECTAGCNITVDAANNKIHRIISRVNEQANGHFICDYGRYAHNKYVEATITSPLLKVEDSWKEVSWEEAYQVIKDQVVATGGGANLRALASPVYPNETNFLLANLVDTVVEKKSLALLPIQNGDDQTFPAGFRISGDKGGNRRGTEDMTRKLTVKPQTLFRGDVGVLLALDGDGRTAIDGDVEKLLKASPFTVILASNMNKFTERANLILPVAGPFQREGTITNDRGLVQWLEPALQLTGEAKPDWQVVAELGQLLTGQASLYTCAGDVTWKISQTIAAYSRITRFKLGKKGQFVQGIK